MLQSSRVMIRSNRGGNSTCPLEAIICIHESAMSLRDVWYREIVNKKISAVTEL